MPRAKQQGVEVSQLLLAWSDGDQSALDRLTPIVHPIFQRGNPVKLICRTHAALAVHHSGNHKEAIEVIH